MPLDRLEHLENKIVILDTSHKTDKEVEGAELFWRAPVISFNVGGAFCADQEALYSSWWKSEGNGSNVHSSRAPCVCVCRAISVTASDANKGKLCVLFRNCVWLTDGQLWWWDSQDHRIKHTTLSPRQQCQEKLHSSKTLVCQSPVSVITHTHTHGSPKKNNQGPELTLGV